MKLISEIGRMTAHKSLHYYGLLFTVNCIITAKDLKNLLLGLGVLKRKGVFSYCSISYPSTPFYYISLKKGNKSAKTLYSIAFMYFYKPRGSGKNF